MISEKYKDYIITAKPIKINSQKWAVSTTIEKLIHNETKSKSFYANDNIHYILEIEATKEAINLGKNLINSNLVGF